MSFPFPDQASEAIQVDQSIVRPTQYIVAISLSILIYDYFLTITREVTWVWNGPTKRSVITILFFLNRYLSVTVAPILVVQYFWESSDLGRISTCKTLTTFHHATIFLSQMLMSAILIIRTHALYERNRWVLILFCTIGMGIIGSSVWALATAPTILVGRDQLPPKGCIIPISLASIQSFMPAIILGVCGEVLIFALTLYKSIQIIKQENSVVLRILLRDGGLYFGIVMLANIAVLISYYASDDYSRGNVATLANSLYATLVSRLILNLRDPHLSSDLRFRYPDRGHTHTSDIMTSVSGSEDYPVRVSWDTRRASDEISLGDLSLKRPTSFV